MAGARKRESGYSKPSRRSGSMCSSLHGYRFGIGRGFALRIVKPDQAASSRKSVIASRLGVSPLNWSKAPAFPRW